MAGLSRKPRIAVLPEQLGTAPVDACASLRVIYPFTDPKVRARFDVEVVGIDAPLATYDAVVFQRFLHPLLSLDDAEELIGSLKRARTRIITDIDDNLLDPHPSADLERTLLPLRSKARLLLRIADCVIVSTPILRQRIVQLNPNVVVSANALPENWVIRTRRRRPRQLVIGYFGTFTHLRDIMTVAAGIRAGLSRLGRSARLALCGVSSDPRLPEVFKDFAEISVVPPIANYPAFFEFMRDLAGWDIGLAPLERGPFEDAKSDIKFLEYTAFGCAGVYSASPAYGTVQDGMTGLVRVNTASDWADAIIRLAEEPGLTGNLVRAAQDEVLETRTFAAGAERLCSILE